jgi:hypothetical protein
MARAHAHCATDGCTHTILFIESTRKLADRKAAWAESQGFICSDCQEKQRQAENAKAAAANQASGLPALTGSDKQIAWAEKIRHQKLETIRQVMAGEMQRMYIDAYWGASVWRQEAMPTNDAHIGYAVELLKSQTAASWWIDRRETKVGYMLRELFVSHPPIQPVEPEEADLIEDAKAEATVRPSEPVTETVAEISAGEDSVSVAFPEKREAFRLLIKKHGFIWKGERWHRRLDNTQGSPADRAAEIGHILLGNGYIVRQYDADIREAMIAGRFETEQTRWISLFTCGKESGRLCIRWSRDEDYYRAAKRLPTARYAKPHLSVAVEQFEQVLDFAEVNNFSITAAAQAAIDEARRVKLAALVADVALPSTEKHQDDGKPAPLPMPENVEVDDDLRD